MQTRPHHYGPQFHLIDNSFLQSLLTELCQVKTEQPQLNRLIKEIYHGLISSTANLLFPHMEHVVKTRMNHELRSPGFDPQTKVVSVNLARAGTYPSHICYEFLHWILPAKNIRQDHIFASRLTNEAEQVTGTHMGGSTFIHVENRELARGSWTTMRKLHVEIPARDSRECRNNLQKRARTQNVCVIKQDRNGLHERHENRRDPEREDEECEDNSDEVCSNRGWRDEMKIARHEHERTDPRREVHADCGGKCSPNPDA